ncbi:MAG TPA: TIR domain-containing protein [Allosphingosinicella sp.]|jgi:hypothetical protein
MAVQFTRSAAGRVQKALADLRSKDATEARKEADLLIKSNRAMEAATRATSPSTRSMKLREAERAQNDLAAVSSRRAGYAKDMASKGTELVRLQEQLAREEEQDRKKAASFEKKLQADRDKQIRALERRLKASGPVTSRPSAPASAPVAPVDAQYDFFISHASEDKEEFVRELANRLRTAGVEVWYDEFSMKLGDSLRRKIDQGLANSRFGLVILSTAFFEKEWPQKELDGLVALEVAGRSRILPIWHKVSKDEVAKFSPTLADKVALNTSILSIDEIVKHLVDFLAQERVN